MVEETQTQKGCLIAGYSQVEWDPEHPGTNTLRLFLGHVEISAVYI